MMKWVTPIRRKLGRNFGIPNLVIIISACQVIVYFFYFAFAQRNIDLLALLSFDRSLILQGQVWRLVTYVFLPPSTTTTFLFLTLYANCLIAYYLEREWDTLGITLYVLLGVIFTSAAGMITGYAFTTYLWMSMFLAFAILFPNFSFLVFFVIPVKAKYLAYLDWLFFIYVLVFQPFPAKIAAILALMNLFLFFGDDYFNSAKNFFLHRKQRNAFREAMKDQRDKNAGDPYGPGGPYG